MLILTNETHGIVSNSLGMHKKGSPKNRVKVKVLKREKENKNFKWNINQDEQIN